LNRLQKDEPQSIPLGENEEISVDTLCMNLVVKARSAIFRVIVNEIRCLGVVAGDFYRGLGSFVTGPFLAFSCAAERDACIMGNNSPRIRKAARIGTFAYPQRILRMAF